MLWVDPATELKRALSEVHLLDTAALHVGLVKAFVRVYFPDAVSDEPICWTCKKNLSQADSLTCAICGWIVCKKCESCGCEYSSYLINFVSMVKELTFSIEDELAAFEASLEN